MEQIYISGFFCPPTSVTDIYDSIEIKCIQFTNCINNIEQIVSVPEINKYQ